jgi:hypothetical protein
MGNPPNAIQPPEQANADLISLDIVRNRLAIAWLAGSLLIVALVVIQSNAADGGVYQSRTADVWKWLFPTVLPTLTMILSVVASTALTPTPTASVRKSYYRIALLLSVFYLVLILYTILILPHYHYVADKLTALQNSNLYIGPIQGVVAGALGVLFVSKKSQD